MKPNATCTECGQKYVKTRPTRVTCGSAECQTKRERRMERKRRAIIPREEVLCPYCEERPLNAHAGRLAKTCGHPDCTLEHKRSHNRRWVEVKEDRIAAEDRPLCPICQIRPVVARIGRVTCGDPDCVTARKAWRSQEYYSGVRNAKGDKPLEVIPPKWPVFANVFKEKDWAVRRFANRSGQCRFYAECLDVACLHNWPSWACERDGKRCPRWIPENEVPVEIMATSAAVEWMESAGVVGRSVRLM